MTEPTERDREVWRKASNAASNQRYVQEADENGSAVIANYRAQIERDTIARLAAQGGESGWRPMTDTAWLDGRDVVLKAHDMEVTARYCKGEWSHGIDGSEYDGPVWSCFDDQFQFEIEDHCEDETEWHHGPVTAWRDVINITEALAAAVAGERARRDAEIAGARYDQHIADGGY